MLSSLEIDKKVCGHVVAVVKANVYSGFDCQAVIIYRFI